MILVPLSAITQLPAAKAPSDLAARTRQPDYNRVFTTLRSQIMEGKLAPGTQLPSTRELAVKLESNFLTVHTALTALTKEGWLDRRHGSGTFIADPEIRFSSAGIYHGVDISTNEQTPYVRSLHFALMKGFERLKKDIQVFIDSRPAAKQRTMLPALAYAIRHKRIQALVVPTHNAYSPKVLARLPIPSAFTLNALTPNQVDYDQAGMLRETVRRLKAQGCRSVGILVGPLGGKDSPGSEHYAPFMRLVREAGLETREEWSLDQGRKLENYGYHEFKRLWQAKHKPDGLFVFPDYVAQQVVMAVLEIGVPKVTRQMKFVFHKNAHIPMLCPFRVTYAVADEELLAGAMIDLIQKQFHREEIRPKLVPIRFEEGASI